MNQIDQSLDDLIKKQREQKKKMKGNTTRAKDTKIPKKQAGGVKSRAAIRTDRAIRAAKPNSPYAAPKVKKETALFTASFKAAKAPIKEIFTAGYIPKPATNLKLITVNRKVGITTGKKQEHQQQPAGPLTTKSMRMVTTQQIKREGLTSATAAAKAKAAAAATASTNRRDERIPTGPRIPETSAHTSGNRGVDVHRGPGHPSGGRQVDRHPTHQHSGDQRGGNYSHQETRSGNLNSRISIPTNNNNKNNINNPINLTSHSNNHNSLANNNNFNSNNANNVRRQEAHPRVAEPAVRQDNRSAGRAATSSSMSMDVDMEVDNNPIAIKGSAPGQQSVAFRGESGPVTIEIANLDPGTTTDDVKYVCSRFGEIRSCDCSHGFAQVTYARKAAGIAAIENLNGKKADNNQILRVTMRAEAIIHEETPSNISRMPSSIAGPMKLLTNAVHGTLRNRGTLYSDNILAAERVLREQQQRMAQLHDEEQRMAMLRMQNAQLGGLSSLSSGGVNRGFF
ncbi:hypothetical protein K457DRAFT_143155 [Linnemannia elongata AG-77]|uniref:RRM domain-containing protein n=1 Tax=Linnemannia elongata AG-77 TaxID=1314771 RepID=A0A197JEL8_9FUNG|nr:hypothetical protein K457DRAFT_143155 [Linnemannia elongata AG-77]